MMEHSGWVGLLCLSTLLGQRANPTSVLRPLAHLIGWLVQVVVRVFVGLVKIELEQTAADRAERF
eukprot:SAG31_NODE_313_length_17858_cov_34.811307_17_plen_65_part_00